jgi:hypothetical protein
MTTVPAPSESNSKTISDEDIERAGLVMLIASEAT